MKKVKIFFSLLIVLLGVCGCNKNDNETKTANIYTTIYPLTYVMEKLYGENNTIASIYPNGVDLNDYSLTDKQIKEYSQAFKVWLSISSLQEPSSSCLAFFISLIRF